ncbi:MAG: DUF4907 domain-containing protein [Chitinophagaceae bacterium]|nr:MAG: DUF4907 domain-containing protein [Chitinophagaceae bacterium]
MTRILFVFLLCGACHAGLAQAATAVPVPSPAASQFRNARLSYKIIPAANGTWCYDIYADGKKIIHQPSVPGLPGTEGFKSRGGAERVAQLVIDKIKKGHMPPSVELVEMKKLGAI